MQLNRISILMMMMIESLASKALSSLLGVILIQRRRRRRRRPIIQVWFGARLWANPVRILLCLGGSQRIRLLSLRGRRLPASLVAASERRAQRRGRIGRERGGAVQVAACLHKTHQLTHRPKSASYLERRARLARLRGRRRRRLSDSRRMGGQSNCPLHRLHLNGVFAIEFSFDFVGGLQFGWRLFASCG